MLQLKQSNKLRNVPIEDYIAAIIEFLRRHWIRKPNGTCFHIDCMQNVVAPSNLLVSKLINHKP